MTNTVFSGDKTITYTESFWTGKKTISINGQELQKIDKKTYKYGDQYCTLKGSYLSGVELTVGAEKIELIRKLTTLETILCFLPLILVFIGGAVGGLCGGAACAFNALYIRKTDKMAVKVVYSVLFTIAACICYYLIVALLLLGLIQT